MSLEERSRLELEEVERFREFYWSGLVWKETESLQRYYVRPSLGTRDLLGFIRSLVSPPFLVSQDKRGILFEYLGLDLGGVWTYNESTSNWSYEHGEVSRRNQEAGQQAQSSGEGNERKTGKVHRAVRSRWGRRSSSKSRRIRGKDRGTVKGNRV